MFLHYWRASVAISGVVPGEPRAQHIQGSLRIELSYATDATDEQEPASAHKSSAAIGNRRPLFLAPLPTPFQDPTNPLPRPFQDLFAPPLYPPEPGRLGSLELLPAFWLSRLSSYSALDCGAGPGVRYLRRLLVGPSTRI